MGIFPQTEKISFFLGQKNNTAACLLPCTQQKVLEVLSLNTLSLIHCCFTFHITLVLQLCWPLGSTGAVTPSQLSCQPLSTPRWPLICWTGKLSVFMVRVRTNPYGEERERSNPDVINHSCDIFSTTGSLFFSLTNFFFSIIICHLQVLYAVAGMYRQVSC